MDEKHCGNCGKVFYEDVLKGGRFATSIPEWFCLWHNKLVKKNDTCGDWTPKGNNE